MHNYSSARLRLLALKWAVTKKFRDCLLWSKFKVYTDNNPLAYIQTSKLGASQIHWLRELALFAFKIQYRLGKTNKAADALSQCPVDPDIEMESISDNDSEDLVVFSYATICATIKPVLKYTKNPICCYKEAQAISSALEGEISVNVPELHEVPNLTVQTSAVLIFDQVLLATVAKAQTRDSVLGLIIQYVHKGENQRAHPFQN